MTHAVSGTDQLVAPSRVLNDFAASSEEGCQVWLVDLQLGL